MTQSRTRQSGVAALLGFTLAMGLSACSSGAPTASSSVQDRSAGASTAVAASGSPNLAAAYLAAVADARIADEAEVVRDLAALRPDNPYLQVSPDGTKVLVATWTDWGGYAKEVGRRLRIERDVWVTAAPELADFCRGFARTNRDPDALALRLAQYLGLPPGAVQTSVATMWAPFDGLFRPAGDPQVDDTSARADPAPADPEYPNYDDWYRLQKSLAYDPSNPYPWTRLGYTYDWGNPNDEQGASEFVIRPGTRVEVVSVDPTVTYCSPDPSTSEGSS